MTTPDYPQYPAEGYMTVPEYARHRNCTDVNVYQAIKAGRLEGAVMIDRLNRKNIDPKVADAQWAKTETVNSIIQRGRRDREKGYGYDGPKRSPLDDDDYSGDDPNILAHKTRNEAIKVALNELALEEKQSKLIDADQVRKETYEMARTIRENMMAIPDRLSSKLAAERDEKKIHAELSSEIRKAIKKCQEIIREEGNK